MLVSCLTNNGNKNNVDDKKKMLTASPITTANVNNDNKMPTASLTTTANVNNNNKKSVHISSTVYCSNPEVIQWVTTN